MAQCEKCGYILDPFETTCRRCAHMAAEKCEICGKQGIAGVCKQCHKQCCSTCQPQKDGLCRICAPEQFAAAPEPNAPPQMLRGISYSTGFSDSVGRAFTFIGQSMGMAFRDKDIMLPSLFSLMINGSLVSLIIWATQHNERLKAFLHDRHSSDWTMEIIFLVLGFISYVITYFFMGMTVHLVSARLHGRDAKLGEAFGDAAKNVLALVMLAGASAVISFAASKAKKHTSLAGDMAIGAMETAWAVVTYLVVPIIILEDVPLRKAFGRAKVLHRRNFMPIAVGEIAVIVLNRILIFTVVLGFVAAGVYAAFMHQRALLTTIIVAGAAVFLVTITFTEFLRAAYYTCLYLWAAEREKVGETARIPAPLAAALGHR
jgi:uncharacterized protein YceK